MYIYILLFVSWIKKTIAYLLVYRDDIFIQDIIHSKNTYPTIIGHHPTYTHGTIEIVCFLSFCKLRRGTYASDNDLYTCYSHSFLVQ